jgi:hypothetical protein
MYYFADIRGGRFEPFGTGFYGKATDLIDAMAKAEATLSNRQQFTPNKVYDGTFVRAVREVVTYPVPFLCGDGSDQIMLDVVYIADGVAIGYDSTCAFCHGDPCAETSAPGTLIAAYFARNSWAETCPCCSGRAT